MLYTLTKNVSEIRQDKSKTCSIVEERFPSSPLTPVIVMMLQEFPNDRQTASYVQAYLDMRDVSYLDFHVMSALIVVTYHVAISWM